jgi:cytidylate kinase
MARTHAKIVSPAGFGNQGGIAMPVITMTREMGSGGKDVAAELARGLNIPLIYHEVIDVVSDKMRVRKSHVVRLLDGHANLLERLTADKTSIAIFTAAEICHLAARAPGAVIRGWGAAHILRSIPHVLSVRVCAPFERRVRTMMERLKTDDVAAVEHEIRESDEAQTAIARRNFHLDWTDATQYDLVLNTERLSIADCVGQILTLARSEKFAETAASRQALADLALQTEVRAALRRDPRTRTLRMGVSAALGRVTFSGVVSDGAMRETIHTIARTVSGVVDVVDTLRSETDGRARYA